MTLSNADAKAMESAVNDILYEHRICFELIERQMVPRNSMELHQEVVAPVLRLLAGRTEWRNVESAYQDALREIAEGHGADAITDAARALQEGLMNVGSKGNDLGSLARSARSTGALAPHDLTLASGLEKIVHSVPAGS